MTKRLKIKMYFKPDLFVCSTKVRTMVHYVRTYIRQYRVYLIYMYTRMPPHGYADHPQDERSHHTVTRTHERFDLWRIIIYITWLKKTYYLIEKDLKNTWKILEKYLKNTCLKNIWKTLNERTNEGIEYIHISSYTKIWIWWTNEDIIILLDHYLLIASLIIIIIRTNEWTKVDYFFFHERRDILE